MSVKLNEIEKKYNFTYNNDFNENIIIELFENDILSPQLIYIEITKFFNMSKYLKIYFNHKLQKINIDMIHEEKNTKLIHICGFYMATVKYNYNAMEKCYLEAIKRNDVDSMYELGAHYYSEKKYDLMKKYLLMAIEHKCTYAMIILGQYYEHNDDENSIKYYTMAYEEGDIRGLLKLGGLYYDRKKYALMKECLIDATFKHKSIFDGSFIRMTTNLLRSYYNRERNKVLKEDVIIILKYYVSNCEIDNIKPFLSYEIINDYYDYFLKHKKIINNLFDNYYSLINLVYCD
jgi:hypothetical protein